MITAVVFDMDGLLFDTENVAKVSWIECADEMGIQGIAEIYHLFIGLNRADGNALLCQIYGDDFPVLEFRQRATDRFQEKIERDGLPVKTGAREILQWLKDNHVKTALASSSRRDVIQHHLERVGFLDYFQLIIGGNMVEHSKPNPDIYLKACRALGVKPEDAMAIEDSPNGIRAAAAAGMCAVMVPDLVAPTPELVSLCDHVFDSLLDVRDYLKSDDLCINSGVS